eukprot:6188579-Pleurochrysis_carterae.AAC.2
MQREDDDSSDDHGPQAMSDSDSELALSALQRLLQLARLSMRAGPATAQVVAGSAMKAAPLTSGLCIVSAAIMASGLATRVTGSMPHSLCVRATSCPWTFWRPWR